jgi:hypothetical protein
MSDKRLRHVWQGARTYPKNVTRIQSWHRTSLVHKDLAQEKLLGRTCLVLGLDMSIELLWNTENRSDKSGQKDLIAARNGWPDMSGPGTRYIRKPSLEPSKGAKQVQRTWKSGGPKHVRSGTWTCLANLTRIWSIGPDMSEFCWEDRLERLFYRFPLHQLTQWVTLDSTELLWLK